MAAKRTAGILMPIFSLPGKYGIGCFSKEAYRFVDFLRAAGQTYWQILPLGPTSYGDSPYQSFSTFAGNPYFIDLEELIKQGLLTKDECDWTDFGKDISRIEYGTLYENRFAALRTAYSRVDLTGHMGFLTFEMENAEWLDDYAFYMAVKNSFGDVSLMEWDDDIRLRDPEAMERYREKLADDIMFYKFVQYEFYREWNALKSYANENGIRIIGDIPIYVSLDSAEVWAHPELFELDANRHPTAVAGCPPDGFSEDGQLWGNPLYKWDFHKRTDYAWWALRMKKSAELYDVIRIDHFRGFDEYYSIPAGAKTARNGKWKKGPGLEFFERLNKEVKGISIIAEDLGFMTDTVRKLVADTGYPNMKVIEFAFDSRDTSGANDYLPHNYGENCVAYTGTHDNETLMGWLTSIKPAEAEYVANYVNGELMDKEDLVFRIIRAVQGSHANYCIIPMQDYLCLDNKARVNTPSTIGRNWVWRMRDGQATSALSKRILTVTRLYGRVSETLLKEEEAARKAKEEKEALAKQEAEKAKKGIRENGDKTEQLVKSKM